MDGNAKTVALSAAEAQAVQNVANTLTIEDLKKQAANLVASLGPESRVVREMNKVIARVERGDTAGHWAPAVPYESGMVLESVDKLISESEDLLKDGRTVMLKITGGDVRLMEFDRSHFRISAQGIRRIIQPGQNGKNEAPRCINIVDLPTPGRFRMQAANELAYEKAMAAAREAK